MRRVLSLLLTVAMMLSLVVVAGAADPVTTGQVTLKVELQGQLENQLEATTLTYRVYLQPQGDAKIGAAQFELTSPDGTTFSDFDVNPALVYTVKPDVKYGSDKGIFELDKLTTDPTTGSMGGTIKNDGKTLSAILAGTDPSKASRMMTSAQSGVYVYQITLNVPGGVKKNVDYTLTVGANPAVGYDDNGTVSTKYRHTVTVVNPQVKYSTGASYEITPVGKGDNTPAYEVEDTNLTVTYSLPCAVAYTTDGVTYTRISATPASDGSYVYDMSALPENAQITVAVKGDLNGDGVVNSVDALLLSRSLIPSTHAAYQELTAVAGFVADVDGSSTINSVDAVFLSRSLVPPTHAAYRALTW